MKPPAPGTACEGRLTKHQTDSSNGKFFSHRFWWPHVQRSRCWKTRFLQRLLTAACWWPHGRPPLAPSQAPSSRRVCDLSSYEDTSPFTFGLRRPHVALLTSLKALSRKAVTLRHTREIRTSTYGFRGTIQPITTMDSQYRVATEQKGKETFLK